MGGVGSDIAVDAADIALVSDDIREIPHLLRLARPDDGDHQMQPDLLYGPELRRYSPCHHWRPQSCRRRTGSQCGLRCRYYTFYIFIKMEEKVMILTIFLIIIGIAIFVGGLYYLLKEKKDPEARKIYTVVTVIGIAILIAGGIKIAVCGF